MGKATKKNRSEERRKIKLARKRTNYLRFGPKENHKGRRQKRNRYGTFRITKSDPKDRTPTPPSTNKRKKLSNLHENHNGKSANRPLQPLRKRRKLSSGDIGKMRKKR